MVAYVLKAVVGQALGDAFHAVGDVGREGLPLLHDAHQLGGGGGVCRDERAGAWLYLRGDCIADEIWIVEARMVEHVIGEVHSGLK